MHALAGTGQVGVATSKSLGNRPQRNRIRRRIQSACRQVGVPSSLDLVVLAKGSAADATYEDLVLEIQESLEELTARWDARSE